MTKIIYSAQKSGFKKGFVYENPRFFKTINPHATSVVVIGDWPDVVAAYQAKKIPVSTDFLKSPVEEPVDDDDRDDEDQQTSTELPPNWEKSTFKTLRRHVKKFDPEKEVKDRAEAIEFIKAHLPA